MDINNNSSPKTAAENRPSVLVVLPVFNEEKVLRESVYTIISFLAFHKECEWHVMIADNDSKDGTADIGNILAQELSNVEYLYIPRKGRGAALRAAWSQTTCDYVSYMDIDLATSLKALVTAVQYLQQGYDVAVGNRLDKKSSTMRSFKRDLISRCYNTINRAMVNTQFHDAQCGFKTARSDVAKKILPYTEDNGWFFDTEFLFYAERLGYKVIELPVIWVEGRYTKVDIFRTACDDLRGLWRLRYHNKLKVEGQEK